VADELPRWTENGRYVDFPRPGESGITAEQVQAACASPRRSTPRRPRPQSPVMLVEVFGIDAQDK